MYVGGGGVYIAAFMYEGGSWIQVFMNIDISMLLSSFIFRHTAVIKIAALIL